MRSRTQPGPPPSGCSRRWPTSTAKYGITVNTVAPGPILTDNVVEYTSKNLGLDSDEDRHRWAADTFKVPAGRMGKPEEIASLIVYLCSDLAGYRPATGSKSTAGCTAPLSEAAPPDAAFVEPVTSRPAARSDLASTPGASRVGQIAPVGRFDNAPARCRSRTSARLPPRGASPT